MKIICLPITIAGVLLFSACASGTSEPSPAPATPLSATGAVGPGPYGTEENPIVWVLAPSQENDAVFAGAIDIVAAIRESTDLVVAIEYASSADAICSHPTMMIALNAFDYLAAHARGCVDAGLIAIQAGSLFLGSPTFSEADYPLVFAELNAVSESTSIPNPAIAFSPDLPLDMRQAIVSALLSLNETEEGLADLKSVYGWDGVEEIADSFYDDLRQQLEAAGVTIENLDQSP